MKRICTLIVCLCSLVAVGLTGCGGSNLEQLVSDAAEGLVQNQTQTKVSIAPPPAGLNEKITIASFNIQVFGESKMKDAAAMKTIVDIARRFDVLAIQEFRAVNQALIPEFVTMLNAEGASYDYLIGPRQGRSVSKEQYVFVYNTQRVQTLDAGFVVPDDQDTLHRPPVASRFAVRSSGLGRPFTFVLMNVHTDPDETDTEIKALASAFQFVQKNMPGEDDVIMVGDFNVGEKKYGAIAAIPNMAWAISGATTNTRGTASYDNIFFDSVNTNEFTGESGVFDFKTEFNLTMEQALNVSDHFPVWAIFTASEQPVGRVAAVPVETVSR
jgi:endonuclease/exonuclease/phosphatase family metal-dependent hydrolase